MKKILLILITLIVISCNQTKDFYLSERITTNVYITNVSVAKYTKIIGYVIYKGIMIDVDNGNTGYYYKHYKIKKGDVVVRTLTIYHSQIATGSPYKKGVGLTTSDINFDDLLKK